MKTKKYFIYSFLIYLLLIHLQSCRYNEAITEESELQTPEGIYTDATSRLSIYQQLSDKNKQLIRQIYKKNHYRPIFYSDSGRINQIGKIIQDSISFTLYYGLPQKRIFLNDKISDENRPNSFLQKDIELSVGYLRLLNDLKYGFSDSLRQNQRPLHLSGNESLTNLRTVDDFSRQITAHTPKNYRYLLLRDFLRHHIDTANLGLKLDSITISKQYMENSIKQAVTNIQKLGYSFATDSSLSSVECIQRFQRIHHLRSDGKIGEATKILLEETPLNTALRIAWQMEKSRYEKKYPKRYVVVNIPASQLYYYDADTIVAEHKVVVGKYGHNTPELASRIFQMQLYPYWNVPHSIATKELLPLLQGNINYLKANKMQLMRGKAVIDPHTVKWGKLNKNNFPYKIRQLPGTTNSLGVIRFDFWNKYNVYLHDTPNKWAFGSSIRALSHGCIRTQNPIEFAKTILKLDENKIAPDSLDSIFKKRLDTTAFTDRQRLIKLRKSIPIYIEYNTIAIVPVIKTRGIGRNKQQEKYEEKVALYYDIYYKDRKEIMFFF